MSNEEVQVNHAKFEALSGIVAAEPEPEPEPLVLAVSLSFLFDDVIQIINTWNKK